PEVSAVAVAKAAPAERAERATGQWLTVWVAPAARAVIPVLAELEGKAVAGVALAPPGPLAPRL
ncbi:hypothetical protein, partial [Mycobacterium simiae]|uniref:hypothetical protein n=1 Tax=Mycobacterium simiae TaxID=1784 RepID=UPI001CB6CDA8